MIQVSLRIGGAGWPIRDFAEIRAASGKRTNKAKERPRIPINHEGLHFEVFMTASSKTCPTLDVEHRLESKQWQDIPAHGRIQDVRNLSGKCKITMRGR